MLRPPQSGASTAVTAHSMVVRIPMTSNRSISSTSSSPNTYTFRQYGPDIVYDAYVCESDSKTSKYDEMSVSGELSPHNGIAIVFRVSEGSNFCTRKDISFNDEEERLMILNEIKMLQLFDDKVTPKVLHVTVKPNLYRIYSEIYDGDVDTLMTTHSVQTETANQIIKQMVLATQCIHSTGVAHRDIKLKNFVYKWNFSQNTANIIVKMIDFGESIVFEKEHDPRSFGSIGYIPPESVCLAGRNHFPCQADIWSLGTALYNIWCLDNTVLISELDG
eukprot:534406_1